MHSLQRNSQHACCDVLVLSCNVAEQGLSGVDNSTEVPDICVSKDHYSRGHVFEQFTVSTLLLD